MVIDRQVPEANDGKVDHIVADNPVSELVRLSHDGLTSFATVGKHFDEHLQLAHIAAFEVKQQ